MRTKTTDVERIITQRKWQCVGHINRAEGWWNRKVLEWRQHETDVGKVTGQTWMHIKIERMACKSKAYTQMCVTDS